jgi:hypothetical protein
MKLQYVFKNWKVPLQNISPMQTGKLHVLLQFECDAQLVVLWL